MGAHDAGARPAGRLRSCFPFYGGSRWTESTRRSARSRHGEIKAPLEDASFDGDLKSCCLRGGRGFFVSRAHGEDCARGLVAGCFSVRFKIDRNVGRSEEIARKLGSILSSARTDRP